MRRELARERLGTELELEPLEPAAVDALLRELLGVELERAVARLFADHGGGNPFVTEELVRAAVEAGRLDPEEGVWRGAYAVELPWTVTEMVLSRLRRLEDGDQELARWAAVAGERVDPELLRAAGGLSEEQLLAGLSRLRAAGILEDEGDGAMAFRHALTHQAVLGTLVGPDRQRRHAALLDAGEARAGSGSEVPLEVLLGHAVGSGRRAEAFRYARLAAERSLELGGETEAVIHVERALELWSPVEGKQLRAELLLQHGRLLNWAVRDHARAGEVFAAAARTFAMAGRSDEALLARALSAAARWWAGDLAALDALRATAAELSEDAPAEVRLEVLSELARVLMMALHLFQAAEIAERALALVPARPARRARLEQIDLLMTLGVCRGVLGDREQALGVLRESARLAEEHRDPVGACRAYGNLVSLTYEVRDAADVARAGLAVARQYGLRSHERLFLLQVAWEETEQGRFAEARQLIETADRIPSPWAGRLGVSTNLGRLSFALGEFEDARVGFTDALRAVVAAGDPSPTTEECALAETLLALGDLDAARAALAPSLERARGANAVEDQIRSLVVAAQIAAIADEEDTIAGVAEELADIAPRDPRTRLVEALAAAAGSSPLGAALVLEATTAHAEAGWRADALRWRLTAAEALARRHRAEAVDLAARALEDFRELGAVGWCRKAERLLRRLGRRVPSWASGAGRNGLTARELEVLRLLTEGASNRAIAERLVISENTAIRHVSNIFAKLRVHTRAQAVRVALETGLLDEALSE